MFKIISSSSILIASLYTTFSFAASSFSLLENSRNTIKFPEYSLKKRKLVFNQAKLIINEMYVNKEIKKQHFKVETDKAFDEIEANIERMPIEEFHFKLSEIYLTYRDLHTLYYFPKPFSCHTSFLPVLFRDALDESGKPVIAVRKIDTNDEINSLLKSPLKMNKGDILLSYDGMTPDEAIQKFIPMSGGANDSSARALAILALNQRGHSLDQLPEKNSITAVFRNRQGKVYQQELPWISKKDLSCINQQQSFQSFKKRNAKIGNAEVLSDNIYSSVIQNPYGSFGLLEIYEFDMDGADENVTRIKYILKDEFKNTDGLIIDVRGNDGGSLVMSERMLQLVSPKHIDPLKKIMKTTDPLLHYFFYSSPEDDFTKAIIEARKENAEYIRPLPLVSEEEVNDLGQFYFKPVAIFTDGRCYSACDALAAQLQDHGLATVFGETETTAGGGANVFKHSFLIEDLGDNPGPFVPLPNGQEITFSVRQTIRNGLNAGKPIEDYGITSDRIVKPILLDMYTGDTVQYVHIGKFLSQESLNYTSSIEMSEERQDFKRGSKAGIALSWEDTESIRVLKDEKEIGRSETKLNAQDETLNIPVETNKVEAGRVALEGILNSKNVWRRILNYRIVPEATVITSKTPIKVQDFAIYATNSSIENGWKTNGETLRIGNGIRYTDNVTSEASLFIKPTGNLKFNFTAEINTEEGYDFFNVIMVIDGKEMNVIGPLSGNIKSKNYSLDLSIAEGQEIEIRFRFKSDEATHAKGITLSKIHFK